MSIMPKGDDFRTASFLDSRAGEVRWSLEFTAFSYCCQWTLIRGIYYRTLSNHIHVRLTRRSRANPSERLRRARVLHAPKTQSCHPACLGPERRSRAAAGRS